MNRVLINIKGTVQGVGFRPFVYNLAKSMDLKGNVTNTTDGVAIDIEGEDVSSFIERISREAPPLSKINNIEVLSLPFCGYEDFEILKSSERGSFTLLSPDVSICDDCLREMLDRHDRRYLYPFINCINCGPRFTITGAIPYDRHNTTMSAFKMCPECEREYNDPADRRFHAQPNACPICGPRMEFKLTNKTISKAPSPSPSPAGGEGKNIAPPLRGGDKGEGDLCGFTNELLSIRDIKDNEDYPSPIPLPQGEGARGRVEDPIGKAINLLKQGAIIAIKGLGGFHIACDATNIEAVERLRAGKRRSNKPFALMSPDIETIEKYCLVSEDEKKMLISNKRPIVLLREKDARYTIHDTRSLPEAVAPNNRYLGFMLPYTPLHYLLFYYPLTQNSKLKTQNFSGLVMTSGNLSEEPIVISNDEAVSKLSGIVDAVLIHNRDIFMRTDDSVVTQHILSGKNRPLFIRRSRGYAPEPIALNEEGPEVLGCGADIKNTFTLTKGSYAIPSQHIGDMENYETLKFFEESLENLKKVYRISPEAIGYDLHPNYLSTKWALSQNSEQADCGMRNVECGIKSKIQNPKSEILLFGIQHHYAHIASVMAENGIKRKVMGIAFDGTGYGTDGNLWGSEFLIADVDDFKRAGHFKYIPLPGGETAIKEPWRIAVSYIRAMAGDETMHYLSSIGFVEKYGNEGIDNILKIIDNRDFSPLSSGAGRLFDAISAILGICDRNTFEGEAAISLESFTIDDNDEDYPVDIIFKEKMEVDFSMTIFRLIEDLKRGVDKEIISTKFHNTVVTVIERVIRKLGLIHRLYDVILSGGVFQNRYLLKNTIDRLKSSGMNVYINEKVPCNDAGISLGQAYLVRERMKQDSR